MDSNVVKQLSFIGAGRIQAASALGDAAQPSAGDECVPDAPSPRSTSLMPSNRDGASPRT